MLLPPRGRAHELGEFAVDKPSRDVPSKLKLGVELNSRRDITYLCQLVHTPYLRSDSVRVNVSRFLIYETRYTHHDDRFLVSHFSNDGNKPFTVVYWGGEHFCEVLNGVVGIVICYGLFNEA